MSAKNLFQFNNSDLLVHQDVQGEVWFRGTNVCSILGYSNSSETLKAHVPDYLQELAIGAGKPAYYVAEKGLYILAFRSKTPKALEFQLWAADVIKSIRTTGGYISPDATPEQVEMLFDTYQAQAIAARELVKTLPLDSPKIGIVARNIKALDNLAKEEQRSSTVKVSKDISEDPLFGAVQQYLEAHEGLAIALDEVLEGIPACTWADQRNITAIMRQLGWDNKRVWIGSDRVRRWVKA